MEIDKKALGMRISNIRRKRGLTLEEFGKLVYDAGKSTVSKWERGLTVPNNIRLKKIAQLGDISIDVLMYGGMMDFIVSNWNELLPSEYKFIYYGMYHTHIQVLANKVTESGATVLDIEKIKSIILEQLPSLMDDIEKYITQFLNYISNHTEYKNQATELILSGVSPFDRLGFDKVEYIFDNAQSLTFNEKVELSSGIEQLQAALESVANKKTYYSDTWAFFISENFLLTELEQTDFNINTTLERHELHYKVKVKPFPSRYESHELLVEIDANNNCDFLKVGDQLLVFYFPNFKHEFLPKYFIDEKIVVIHNNNLYVGVLDSDLIFKTMMNGQDKLINLKNTSVRNNIFPLAAIFY